MIPPRNADWFGFYALMLCVAQALCKLFKAAARKHNFSTAFSLCLGQEKQSGRYALITVQYNLKFSENIPL